MNEALRLASELEMWLDFAQESEDALEAALCLARHNELLRVATGVDPHWTDGLETV